MKKLLDYLLIRITPSWILLIYFVVITLFACMYYYLPNGFDSKLQWVDSYYFSITTVSTLGFGDITPISNFGKILCAIEALLGIFLLGIFMISVANLISLRQERKRINAAKYNLKIEYKYWRSNVVDGILFLTNPGQALSYELSTSES